MRCCDSTQLILFTVIICTNSVYALASLFLPMVLASKSIPGFWVGLVFAIYAIAVVFASPIVGTILNKTGFPNLIAIGLVMMSCSIVPVGFLMEIQNDLTTLAVCILLRALQGTASACINTTCYSLAANKYVKDTTFVVAMLEGMSGIGIVVGQFGGSIVYEALGYRAVFVAFGLLLLIMALVTRILFMIIEKNLRLRQEELNIPSTGSFNTSISDRYTLQATLSQNEAADDDDDEYQRVKVTEVLNLSSETLNSFDDERLSFSDESTIQLSYIQMIKTPRILFALLSATLSNFVFA